MLFPLSKLDLGQTAEICWLSDHRSVTPRLLDLGFEPGTRVTCMLKKCGGELAAYLVKGAVIAIRREDAEAVLVRDIPAAEYPEYPAGPQKGAGL